MKPSKTEIKTVERAKGKHHSRKFRTNKLIPSIVYGPKVENQIFCIPELTASRLAAAKFDSEIFVLRSDNKALDGLEVLRKAIDKHPLTHRPVHLDFYALDKTKLIKVPVEIHLEGVSPGVKEEGGVLNILLREVEVESLPDAIPEKITVDINNLHLNDVVHVSDLTIDPASKAKITSNPGDAVIKVSKSTGGTEATDVATPDAPAAAEAPEAATGAPEKKKS